MESKDNPAIEDPHRPIGDETGLDNLQKQIRLLGIVGIAVGGILMLCLFASTAIGLEFFG